MRKRVGADELNRINEVIYRVAQAKWDAMSDAASGDSDGSNDEDMTIIGSDVDLNAQHKEGDTDEPANKGRMLLDATACPQHIAYPTVLILLNTSREKCEEIIEKLYIPALHAAVKPRTNQEKAHKVYLNTAKKNNKTRTEIKSAIWRQLRCVRQNLKIIETQLATFEENPLTEKYRTYVETICKVFEQQKYMRKNKTHNLAQRIVSIHQPHVRSIVRGKEKAKVEFGSKINLSLVDGYAFLDHLSWEAYNEGGYLMQSLTMYKERHGYYPAEVM
jgi:IS5 family transposase